MGALILAILLACAWPVSAPVPSQPLIVEVSLGDTAEPDSSTEAGHPRPEAVDPEPQTSPQAGGAAAETDPGVGGNHAH